MTLRSHAQQLLSARRRKRLAAARVAQRAGAYRRRPAGRPFARMCRGVRTQARERPLDRLVGEASRCVHALTQAGDGRALEQRAQPPPASAFGDQQQHRVGADVDGRDATRALTARGASG